MALVDYTSSDEDEAESVLPETSSSKRKREKSASDLPPLPSKFHDLYASTVRTSVRDDPALHGGRKRAAPHVEGNWPTHVYIEWFPSTKEDEVLAQMIKKIRKEVASLDAGPEIHSFLSSESGAPLPLHISLSRPIGFPTEQKDSFVDSLERSINASGIRPFDVSFSGFDWVSNFEKTRWFLVLRIHKPEQDGLNKLLHISNTVVQQHGQPPLYTAPKVEQKQQQPSPKSTRKVFTTASRKWSGLEDVSSAFHVSIAWTLKAPDQELLELTAANTKDCLENLGQIHLRVEDIKSKVGNIVTNVPLQTSVIEGKGLFGP